MFYVFALYLLLLKYETTGFRCGEAGDLDGVGVRRDDKMKP